MVTRGGKVLSSARDLRSGDELELRLKDGSADVGVKQVRLKEDGGA